ncbi:MAG: hypothetical protein ABIP74_01980 [Candidatus Saccharimonas sp.]
MQKDVIYIDVEDDITAIIGKVKASEHKIVALVPPKRTGAIQSAVNLKLVQRAADTAGKRLVLISNNAALVALAASASIPVARNLQSKPELAEIPVLEVDEDDDIIDGSKIRDGTKADEAVDSAVEDIDATDDITPAIPAKKSREALGVAALAKARIKIPNFDTFRKRLFIIIGAVIALSVFLIWALVFAPNAKIIVTARTTDSQLNTKVTLGDTLATSLKDGTLKTVTKTSKKTVSVPFTATGQKDVGEKATGTVRFKPTDTSIFLQGATIPAKTAVTINSKVFYTDDKVVFDSNESAGSLAAGKTMTVTAAGSGTSYNGFSGAASGPSGFSTTFTVPASGGTDKTITVVQQSDIDAVSTGVGTTTDQDAAKVALKAAFGDTYVLLSDSFKQDTSGVKAVPAVGAESADGKGALSGDIVYTMIGAPKVELSIFLDAYFKQQIDGMANQKIYRNGLSTVAFTNFARSDTSTTATIAATGKYGPLINEKDIKSNAKGKRFGEIQSNIQAIPGVDSVDIKFSPFWVTAAPNDDAKIQVEFNVNGS